MKTTELRCKEIVRYLALFFGNCEEELQIWDRARTAPISPTVYLLIDKNDKIVKVGQTNCLRRRLAELAKHPKTERLQWVKYGFFSPQVKNIHVRLQIETALAALAVPPGNPLIALRRRATSQWREVQWSISQAEKKRQAKKTGSTKWSDRRPTR